MTRAAIISIIILVIIEIILLLSAKTELAYYNLFLVLVFVVIFMKKTDIPIPYLAGLLFVGILNALGGLLYIDGVRLYDVFFGILRIDMVIHFLGTFFALLILNHLVKKYKLIKARWIVLFSALIILGLAAVFEVLELAGMVLLNTVGVGDYWNNAIDLLSNLLGVLAGAAYIVIRKQ